MNTTKHAAVRMQQRGIPPLILEWLLEYGATTYDGHGGRIRYFDKQAKQRIRHSKGEIVLRRLHELFDSYAVVSNDGAVVTVGHRYKRAYRQ